MRSTSTTDEEKTFVLRLVDFFSAGNLFWVKTFENCLVFFVLRRSLRKALRPIKLARPPSPPLSL